MLPQRRDTLITGDRIVLLPPEKNDFSDWSACREASRSHLEPWEPRWPTDAHSREDWKRRLLVWKTGWRAGNCFVFLIRTIDTDTLVGGVSLTNVRKWPALSASLGYWLAADQEGKGLMREAVRLCCAWAFAELKLERIDAGTLQENERSRKVLASCGFLMEGVARSYLEINGMRRDHVLYGLVRPDLEG